jgi:hypothetical protein
MTVRESDGVYFIKIEFSGIAAFESGDFPRTEIHALSGTSPSPSSDEKETLHSALIPSPLECLRIGFVKWQGMEWTSNPGLPKCQAPMPETERASR